MLVAFSFARKLKSVKRRQPEIGPAVSLYGQSRYICHVFVRIQAIEFGLLNRNNNGCIALTRAKTACKQPVLSTHRPVTSTEIGPRLGLRSRYIWTQVFKNRFKPKQITCHLPSNLISGASADITTHWRQRVINVRRLLSSTLFYTELSNIQ